MDSYQRIWLSKRTFWHILFFLFFFFLSVLYLYGAYRHAMEVNTDSTRIDQSAYINYAIQIHESKGSYIGDRNRMPLYPYLQSVLYQTDWDENTFFIRGKYLNIALSFAGLLIIALIFSRLLDGFTSVNLILITGFSVFIFKAGYFQAEILFYFLSFLLFLIYLWMIYRPSIALAIIGGMVAGLAQLTKASILPGILILTVVLLFQYMRDVTVKNKQEGNTGIQKHARSLLLAIFWGFFFLTLFPYLQNSKDRFTQYFYNVNSTFYFWYDSWGEAVEGTRAHGDRVGWPELPADEIPSITKYLNEHSMGEISRRIVKGSKRIIQNVKSSYGYAKYILYLFLILIFSVLLNPRRTLGEIRRHPLVFLFVGAYLMGYFLLYAWYTPIAQGNRLILALFLPLVFALSYAFSFLLQSGDPNSRSYKRNRSLSTITNLVLLMILIVDIYSILSNRLYAVFGGF